VTFNTAQAPINRVSVNYTASATPIVPATPKPDVAKVPTLMGFDQFLGDTVATISLSFADALSSTEALSSGFPNTDALQDLSSGHFQDTSHDISFASLFSPEISSESAPSIRPVQVTNPVPPKRIDTSFMQPEMLLLPADLSALREQNPQVQITPDQWRILTCVNGQTTLKAACQTLAMPPEQFCQVAGELVAEHLLHVSLPDQTQMNESSPLPHEQATSGLSNGHKSAYAAVGAISSSGNLSIPDVQLQFPSSLPFETESQWGNGGNGATFVPGRGWITTPQPLQPLQSPGPLVNSTVVYTQVSNSMY